MNPAELKSRLSSELLSFPLSNFDNAMNFNPDSYTTGDAKLVEQAIHATTAVYASQSTANIPTQAASLDRIGSEIPDRANYREICSQMRCQGAQENFGGTVATAPCTDPVQPGPGDHSIAGHLSH